MMAFDEAGVGFDSDFDPIAYINTPRWQTSRLGLGRIAALLDLMGRPQDDLRFVHVAGTNGKGSTCAYISSVLTAAGYRTGLFTSPFIETFEERIRVDGRNISASDLERATLAVRRCAEEVERQGGEHPTEFELMTAVALDHFRAARCDIVVLEVGLGGRLDSTNVVDRPEVSVIARIGLDHVAILGDSLAQIASEKAGIVKSGAPVVSWPQDPESMAVVARAASEKGCALSIPDFSQLTCGKVTLAASDAPDGFRFASRRFSYRGEAFETRLLGSYQPMNAALAIEAVCTLREKGWSISNDALRRGIADATWPGRFEVVAQEPTFVVDGGHNPQGAVALADSLADVWGNAAKGRVTFVMGVLADKDYPSMVRAIAPFARAFFLYAPDNPRALPADELAEAVRMCCDGLASDAVAACSGAAEAVARARQAAGADGTVVAFGSLYSVADIKRAARG